VDPRVAFFAGGRRPYVPAGPRLGCGPGSLIASLIPTGLTVAVTC
jgi:hypothetical protein